MSVARKTISRLLGGLFCLHSSSKLFIFEVFPSLPLVSVNLYLHVISFAFHTRVSPSKDFVDCQLASGRRYFRPVLHGQYFLMTSGRRDSRM